MMKRVFLCLMAAWLMQTTGWAQTLVPNLKFGKPTDEELTMTTYAPDSEAVAVVLCEQTVVDYQYKNSFYLNYSVKRRIKVLKEEGREYANVSIPYYTRFSYSNEKERITKLKATAYNMENGKLVKTRMGSENEFTEKLSDDRAVKKFTIPQVKVGTVLEYEYELESDNYINIYDWYAQCSLPTYYTSYSLMIPEWFVFSVEETGPCQMTSKKEDTTQAFLLTDGTFNCSATKYFFEAHELPAVHDDNYIWAARDYSNHVTAELSGINIPGEVYKNYSFSWDDVATTLLDNDDFSKRMKQLNPLEKEMQAAGLMTAADKRQQAQDIYRLLKKRVRWNGDYALLGQSSSTVLKDGTGTNADINFVLISMLRSAGLKACPVVLRLRDKGRLPTAHASIKYLSTFVVGVFDSDSTLCFLDGSADDGVNVLPSRMLTDRAYLIDPDGSNQWISLQGISKSRDVMQISGKVNADGTISGHVKDTYQNNAAAAMRLRFKEESDSTKFVEKLAERREMEINGYQLTGHRDDSTELTEEYDFTKSCEVAADHIYFNPLVLVPWKESPFKTQERLLPVEFPFMQTETITAQLALPEGYEVEDMPKGLRMQLGDGDISCRLRCLQNEGSLFVTYQFTVNRLFFSSNEYADLKASIDQVVQNTNAMVVLKKI